MTPNRLLEDVSADPHHNLELFGTFRMWTFFQFSTVPGFVPRTRMGLVPTKEEWEELAAEVDKFYEAYDDETILELRDMPNEEEGTEGEPVEQVPAPRRKSPGHIYLAYVESGHYKIGLSKNPTERIKQLNTNAPHEITLIHTFPADHAKAAEEILHIDFASKRVKGEWFALDEDDVAWLCSVEGYDDGTFHANY